MSGERPTVDTRVGPEAPSWGTAVPDVVEAVHEAVAAERRACIHALCGACRSGREPQYRDARHQGLPPGWFHTADSVPGALVRCPASALWERGVQ
jgi:hypothetical protein